MYTSLIRIKTNVVFLFQRKLSLLLYLLITISTPSNANDSDMISLINKALFRQAPKGSLENVDLLLKMGANPNARNENNETVLIWASRYGRPDIVAFLLEAGAEPNAQDSNGDTALMWACKNDDYSNIVEILLGYGAGPNIQNKHEQIALKIAIMNDNFNIVKMLLEKLKCIQALSK